jgi:hypothetical protein
VSVTLLPLLLPQIPHLPFPVKQIFLYPMLTTSGAVLAPTLLPHSFPFVLTIHLPSLFFFLPTALNERRGTVGVSRHAALCDPCSTVLLPNSSLSKFGESLPAFTAWILTRRMTGAVGSDSARGADWSNSQVGPSSIHVEHLPTSSLASRQTVMARLSTSTARHVALEKSSASHCIRERMGPLHGVPVELEQRPRLLEVAAAFTLSIAADSLCSWRKERGEEMYILGVPTSRITKILFLDGIQYFKYCTLYIKQSQIF